MKKIKFQNGDEVMVEILQVISKYLNFFNNIRKKKKGLDSIYYSVNAIIGGYSGNSRYVLKWLKNPPNGVPKEIVGKRMKLVKAINPNASRKEEPVSVLTSTFIENLNNATLTSKEVAKKKEKHQHFISSSKVLKQKSAAKRKIQKAKKGKF